MIQNPIQMIQLFNQFRNEYTPEKAQEEVQKLLSSGRMNQTQLNQLQKDASIFQNFLRNLK